MNRKQRNRRMIIVIAAKMNNVDGMGNPMLFSLVKRHEVLARS